MQGSRPRLWPVPPCDRGCELSLLQTLTAFHRREPEPQLLRLLTSMRRRSFWPKQRRIFAHGGMRSKWVLLTSLDRPCSR
jgi:hypothetical protein